MAGEQVQGAAGKLVLGRGEVCVPEEHRWGEVGFPAPWLGRVSWRLPVCAMPGGLLAVVKPEGVLSRAHPAWPEVPDLDRGLAGQLREGKPELRRLGLEVGEEPRSVHWIDPECSGLALFSLGAAATEFWRNLAGSGGLRFRFLWLGRDLSEPGEGDLRCELPIREATEGASARISHRQGRKAWTCWHRRERFPSLELVLWEAETDYPRTGLIPLHAEALGIAAKEVEGGSGTKRKGASVGTGPIYHLEEISWFGGPGVLAGSVPAPVDPEQVGGESGRVAWGLPKSQSVRLQQVREGKGRRRPPTGRL